MQLDVVYDYAKMTDAEMAQLGLRAARRQFEGALEDGLLNGDSLFVLVGELVGDNFVELGREGFGLDWEQFVKNVSPEDGKLATVAYYLMDSADAFERYGESVGPWARQWTGGVFYRATVRLKKSGNWRERRFAAAASGVQGNYDADVVSAALRRMAAAWAQRELALEAAGAKS